jgi:hypothetical protein
MIDIRVPAPTGCWWPGREDIDPRVLTRPWAEWQADGVNRHSYLESVDRLLGAGVSWFECDGGYDGWLDSRLHKLEFAHDLTVGQVSTWLRMVDAMLESWPACGRYERVKKDYYQAARDAMWEWVSHQK